MYKKAVKNNSKYLKPFVQGIKLYGSDEIQANVGTMLVINENGTLLTCKHIAEEIYKTQMLLESYPNLLSTLATMNKNESKKFLKENKINNDTAVLSVIHWMFQIKEGANIQVILHPVLDLAIIKFEGITFKQENYPIFSKNLPEQGQSVCKLGYAFPMVNIFEYNQKEQCIAFKENGNLELPLFPMDGIVTRHINLEIDNNRYDNVWFETSSPGFRGQSGGPIFGPDGVIYGIQSLTSHMDLNFDINANVKRGNKIKKVSSTPFINFEIGISSIEIIKFLEENNIQFNIN